MASEDVDMNAGSSGATSDPEMDWVKVTSTDGFEYLVRRKLAKVSGTMKSMLDTESNYSEAVNRTCPVIQRGAVVERLVQYMAFKAHHESRPKEEIPVNEFIEQIPVTIVLEVLVAADFQDM